MSEQPIPIAESIDLSPSVLDTLPAVYRQYAEGAALLGMTELAERCERQASACEYGGTVNLRGAL